MRQANHDSPAVSTKGTDNPPLQTIPPHSCSIRPPHVSKVMSCSCTADGEGRSTRYAVRSSHVVVASHIMFSNKGSDLGIWGTGFSWIRCVFCFLMLAFCCLMVLRKSFPITMVKKSVCDTHSLATPSPFLSLVVLIDDNASVGSVEGADAVTTACTGVWQALNDLQRSPSRVAGALHQTCTRSITQ